MRGTGESDGIITDEYTALLEVYERAARIFARAWTHRFPHHV